MDSISLSKAVIGYLVQLGILTFVFSIVYGRYRESENQKDSLELFINLFKEELRDNHQFIRNNKYKLYEDPDNPQGDIKRYIKLKTGAWQLVAGSPELKYLPKEKLQKIALAYTTVFDLNDLSESLNSQLMLNAPVGNLKPFYGVSAHLHKKAVEATKDAYESIKDYEVKHQSFLGFLSPF